MNLLIALLLVLTSVSAFFTEDLARAAGKETHGRQEAVNGPAAAQGEPEENSSVSDSPWIGPNYCAARNDPETSPYVMAANQQCDGGGGGGGGSCRPPMWECLKVSDPGAEQESEKVTITEAGSVSGQEVAAKGCKTIDVRIDSFTWMGYHAWDFHQQKYWCWTRPHITQVNVGTSIHIDGEDSCCFRYAGVVGSYGWYYQWTSGASKSGHFSFRQASVENCLLKFGCIGAKYPWIKIWVHGDGSWKARTGGG